MGGSENNGTNITNVYDKCQHTFNCNDQDSFLTQPLQHETLVNPAWNRGDSETPFRVGTLQFIIVIETDMSVSRH